MKCPKCGFESPEGASFCRNCGTHFDTIPQQQPGAGQAAQSGPAGQTYGQQPQEQWSQQSYQPQSQDYQQSYQTQNQYYQPYPNQSYQPAPVPPKKKKKVWLWILIIIAAIVILIAVIGSLGGKDSGSAVSPSPSVSATQAATPTPAPTVSAGAAETSPSPSPTQASVYTDQQVIDYINSAFSGSDTSGTFDYAEISGTECNIYLVAPDGTAETILNDPSSLTSSWDTMKSSLCDACDTFTYSFSLLGRSDLTANIYLENDTNHENMLLQIANGEVVYDVMSDSNS